MVQFGSYDEDDNNYEGWWLSETIDFLIHALYGMFIHPVTPAEQIARWSALPCVLLPMAVGLLILLIGYHSWMTGFLVIGGLSWLCYSGWVCTTLERAYHRYELAARRNPNLTLADFNRRQRSQRR
ncbi:hypothetical protein C5Y93_09325 [Blastopirellula marina]|uniref:Uncharacterized protein n=2 Tax=Blastopirellula marina TaxID=124 RepID=A0A2S8GPA1_9BACT|nr:hypothetical protein C5Y93_09325 [Blastopirellula marina]